MSLLLVVLPVRPAVTQAAPKNRSRAEGGAVLSQLAAVVQLVLAAVPFQPVAVWASRFDDPSAAVLQASDGSADGARKIAAAVMRRKMDENAGEIPIIVAFATAQLDLALGRSNVVHAALLAGPGGETFLARVKRLERFRSGNLPDDANATAPANGANELSAPTDGAQGNSTE